MTKKYFNCIVEVFLSDEEWHPFPWTFTVTPPDEETYHFHGIPNQCRTKASALKRAWYRAKWLASGTFDQHYG